MVFATDSYRLRLESGIERFSYCGEVIPSTDLVYVLEFDSTGKANLLKKKSNGNVRGRNNGYWPKRRILFAVDPISEALVKFPSNPV